MATISENLQTIKSSTDAIKQTIVDKGGIINEDITTWAEAINWIDTDGGGTIGVQCFFIRAIASHPVTGDVRFDHTYTFLLENAVVWGDCDGKLDINGEANISAFNINGKLIIVFAASEIVEEFTPQEPPLEDTVLVVCKTYEFSY